jgi:hypothetical protein
MKSTAKRKATHRRPPSKSHTLTVRRIEPDLGARLRESARKEGLSVEEHVRRTLRAAHPPVGAAESWVDGFRRRVLELTDGEGFDFEPPQRSPGGPPPDFSGH